MNACRRRPHATWTSCRCPNCAVDRARTRKWHAAGLLGPSRADEAWDELVRLEREQWSAHAVATAAGVSARAIQDAYTAIRHNRPRTISRTVAEKILTRDTPTRGLVPALGATRRLQALAAIGWSLAELAARTGISEMALSRLRTGHRDQVLTVNDTAIRRMYRELEMTPGPSTITRSHAGDHHWYPPLAWEDIDHPDGLADTA